MSAFVKRKHNIYFLYWRNALGKRPSCSLNMKFLLPKIAAAALQHILVFLWGFLPDPAGRITELCLQKKNPKPPKNNKE